MGTRDKMERLIQEETSKAFQRAIDEGRLSRNKDAKNYAGYYRYMDSNSKGGDAFKNIISMEYDA